MIEFTSKTPITKGWSGDKKYCITDSNGIKYLLRVSLAGQYNRKKSEFETMQHVAALGVPMCQPIEFGICDEEYILSKVGLKIKTRKKLFLHFQIRSSMPTGLKRGRF